MKEEEAHKETSLDGSLGVGRHSGETDSGTRVHALVGFARQRTALLSFSSDEAATRKQKTLRLQDDVIKDK